MRLLFTIVTTLALALSLAAPASAHRVKHKRPWLCQHHSQGQLVDPVHGRSYRTQGFHRWHRALDLAGRRGSPVRSVAWGRVVRVQHLRYSYGINVTIKHPCGKSRYAHLRGERVHRGQIVKRGQMIGRRGSTGNSTGAHLHMILKRKGRTVAPGPWIW